MQCVGKKIKNIKWKTDIQQYDLFLGVLEGNDGHANHAVAIFNGWIFDSKVKLQFPYVKKDWIIVLVQRRKRLNLSNLTMAFTFEKIARRRD